MINCCFLPQNDLKNLEDACDEIALFDDDEQIPYLVGEVFIYQNLEKTQVIEIFAYYTLWKRVMLLCA